MHWPEGHGLPLASSLATFLPWHLFMQDLSYWSEKQASPTHPGGARLQWADVSIEYYAFVLYTYQIWCVCVCVHTPTVVCFSPCALWVCVFFSSMQYTVLFTWCCLSLMLSNWLAVLPRLATSEMWCWRPQRHHLQSNYMLNVALLWTEFTLTCTTACCVAGFWKSWKLLRVCSSLLWCAKLEHRRIQCVLITINCFCLFCTDPVRTVF